MRHWNAMLAALALSAPAIAVGSARPLALNGPTPAGACSDPGDCGFERAGVRYVSFDKVITRREACVPSKSLLGAARRGDQRDTVRLRLRRAGWAHVAAKRDGDGWILAATSRRDALKWIEVTFDARGRVKCVTEALLTV